MCLPRDVRPIDLFSVILRVIASAATGLLRHWKTCVLHPGQYASRGGVVVACAKIAWATEVSMVGLSTVWAFLWTLPKCSTCSALKWLYRQEGTWALSEVTLSTLEFPTAFTTGVWSLPHGAAPIPYSSVRGLPQGMSTSVLLSELAIAPLLWRVTRVLPQAWIFAYVDDLNFLSSSCDELQKVAQLLRDFEEDFALELSRAKTKVWVTDSRQEANLARCLDFEPSPFLDALGGQCGFRKGPVLEYPKERSRLEQCCSTT